MDYPALSCSSGVACPPWAFVRRQRAAKQSRHGHRFSERAPIRGNALGVPYVGSMADSRLFAVRARDTRTDVCLGGAQSNPKVGGIAEPGYGSAMQEAMPRCLHNDLQPRWWPGSKASPLEPKERHVISNRRLSLMIALLTGPPGVGKSSIAAALAQRHSLDVEIVSFGRLIYEATRSRLGTGFSYNEFRESAADLVRNEDIMAATASIVERKPRLSHKWLIVDSHAVAKTKYGWQAYPDTPETLNLFSYDTIIYLHAPAEVVFRRTRMDAASRHVSTIRDVETLIDIQMSVSTYYMPG